MINLYQQKAMEKINKEMTEKPTDLKSWTKPELSIIDKGIIEGGRIVYNTEQWSSGTAS